VACAIKNLKPSCAVYGVQAEGAASMKKAFDAGEHRALKRVSTFADGIAVKTPGKITFDMVQKYVDDVVTVTDDEVAAAILALLERQKVIAEGAGAVSVAAAMFNKLPIKDKRVVCVVSGGNIDVNILSRVIARGLAMSGRTVELGIALTDKPGQLELVSRLIAECGANVVSVDYDRTDPNLPISSCILRIGMETRDRDQIELIKTRLAKEGFNLVSER
jgi:threonine dehydratase